MHGRRLYARTRIATTAVLVVTLTLVALTASRAPTATAASASPTGTGTLIGQVSAPRVTGSEASVPVADVVVTATGPGSVQYTTTTTAGGWYDLEQLPVGSYSVTVSEPAPAIVTATASATVSAGAVATADARLNEPVATITGAVTGGHGGPLAAMPVSLSGVGGDACATAPACGTQTTSAADGRYTVHVPAGTYAVQVSDAGALTPAQTVTATAGAVVQAPIGLPVPPVPAATTVHQATRDLGRLNAARAADGLPANLTLSERWSDECAAHDDYERYNGVLTSTENPDSLGASAGGAWAGLNSDLAEGSWTSAATPWQNAPIHLLALLAPSLKVVGIDDTDGFQCVTSYPGMVRTPTTTDRIYTYPAGGAKGVPPSELARESPFVPGQFVGIPSGRTAGRELFVYLDLAHQTGQAPVHVLTAKLTTGGRPVALRWVDSQTPTVGRYLAGAILIPVKPLRARTRYTASVSVQDRSGTLSHRWSFETR
jgi:Carboxypeptidase regulatory-like domain